MVRSNRSVLVVEPRATIMVFAQADQKSESSLRSGQTGLKSANSLKCVQNDLLSKNSPKLVLTVTTKARSAMFR